LDLERLGEPARGENQIKRKKAYDKDAAREWKGAAWRTAKRSKHKWTKRSKTQTPWQD